MSEYWSNDDRGYRIRLWVDQASQDIASNTSQVRVRLAFLNTTTTFSGYSCSAYVDINGQRLNWSGSPSVLSYNQTVWLIDQTITVTHDANGTKTIGFIASFSGSGGWSPNTLSIGSSSYALSTIPRTSSISASDFVIGSSESITINRADSSFKHTLRYSWYGTSGTIASNVDTSYSWSVPMTFCNNIANATSGSCTIYCDTYSSSTLIGTQSITVNATVPSSVVPMLTSITLADTNYTASQLVTGSNYVQVISNISVAFNGKSGAYGSTITGVKAEIVGKNQSIDSDDGTLGLMNFSGSATIRAYVIDSRGRTSAYVTSDINVLPYAPPSISFLVNRVGADQKTLQIVRNVSISPLTVNSVQKNTMNLSFSTAPVSTGTYTTDNGSAGGTFTSVSTLVNSSANLGNVYQTDTSYFVRGVLSDAFTSTSFSAKIGTISVNISISRTGVGVNKVWEQGAVDVLGAIYSNGSQIQHYQLTSNDGRSPYNASGTVDLNTKTVNSFFSCNEPTNGPTIGTGRNQFYISVYSESDNYLSQQAIKKDSGRMFTRTRYNGTWTAWLEYAPLNSVAEFTSVNQTKVYTATINGPYGANLSVARCGNIVNASMDAVIPDTLNVFGTAAETIPLGYRPVINQHLQIIGSGGGGTNTTLFNNSYVGATYTPNGKILYITKLTDAPLAFKGSISWITSDPFPS